MQKIDLRGKTLAGAKRAMNKILKDRKSAGLTNVVSFLLPDRNNNSIKKSPKSKVGPRNSKCPNCGSKMETINKVYRCSGDLLKKVLKDLKNHTVKDCSYIEYGVSMTTNKYSDQVKTFKIKEKNEEV
jgi:predicted nucleic-acid-binding Zn-ribbon protein